jgi:hypothetical protein
VIFAFSDRFGQRFKKLSPDGDVSLPKPYSGAYPRRHSALHSPFLMGTGVRLFRPILSKRKCVDGLQRAWVIANSSWVIQRDYFGAHTFRVLPGKENAKFKAGEDIRVYLFMDYYTL